MTDYTVHHAIPYPEGGDRVAVHTDVEALARKVDAELHNSRNLVVRAAQGAVPSRVENLYDFQDTTLGNLTPSGNVFEHQYNRVTDFIRVSPGEQYVSWSEVLHMVVFFDQSQGGISGTNPSWLAEEQQWSHTAPLNAQWVRIGVSIPPHLTDPATIFNRGTVLWSPDGDNDSRWWEDRELPPGILSADEVTKIAHDEVRAEVPPVLPENLFSWDDTVPFNMAETGNLFEHENNRTSGFIPVTEGETYQVYSDQIYRVVFFDAAQQKVDSDTSYGVGHREFIAPPAARYIRLGLTVTPGTHYEDIKVVFNHGVALVDPDNPHNYPPTGYWNNRELPPTSGGSIDEDQIRDIVESLLPQWDPSTPTLEFETIYTGWDEPYWLSSDGEVLYGRRGAILTQSEDEWETITDITTFDQSVQAVRTLSDGELLVSTQRDESAGVKAKLFRSTGYDRSNPTVATWDEVLEAGSTQVNINNAWGLQVYQNIVIAGEYGLRGEEGARRVWMSEDHAQTWELVFDQKTVEAEGQPEWTLSAHLHTAVWDPYWSRLWVVVGDSPSTATYYSDDKGATWHYVEGSGGPSPAVQYTGIIPLPDVVVFGSDRHPNGVYVYRRGEKSDMPVIKPLLLTDDVDQITVVFQMAYKRDWQPTTPTYFAASTASDRGPTIVVGTVDGKKAHLLWEGEQPGSGLELSGDIRWALGPTAQGNIIAPMTADPTVTGTRVLKAPAPTWARA